MDRKEHLKRMGLRIRNLRILKGYTQKELADLVGFSAANGNTAVNKLESGNNDIPTFRLLKIARALGTSTDYIITGRRDHNDRDNDR